MFPHRDGVSRLANGMEVAALQQLDTLGEGDPLPGDRLIENILIHGGNTDTRSDQFSLWIRP